MFNRFCIYIIIITFLIAFFASGQTIENSGIIRGVILDKDTKEPLAGANIVIANTQLGAASDANGNYIINNVTAGYYTLEFSFIGYSSLIKTDIIVRPNRTSVVSCELGVSALSSEVIKVTAGYFSDGEAEQVSVINFSAEEIRRSPGTAGDVSRIVMSLPSIAKVNDQSNSLIVRGGSPIENGFYVDNIEIPNINHFPTQGSSGGPIGILNVDFIKDVHFYSGGFSASYGDRLSSIMDVTFREGNRDRFEGQLDLNFAGFGGALEGPLPNDTGSWMFSLKRSYLDLIIKTVDLGTSIAPVYGDFQGKLVYDINPENQLTFLSVIGDDHSESTKKVAEENNMPAFGHQDYLEATAGLNWRKIWKKSGYSNTSFSYTSQKHDNSSYDPGSGFLLRTADSHEESFKIRNINHFKLTDNVRMDFGLQAKWFHNGYNSFYAAYTDILGKEIDEFDINKTFQASRLGGFVSLDFNWLQNFSSVIAIRTDYFDLNKNTSIAPRASISYMVNDAFSINVSHGLFYQELPFVLLAQLNPVGNIETPKATHTIIGFGKKIFDDTKVLIEFFNKEYSDFPMDPMQADLFLIDELYYNGYENFLNHPHMGFYGQARSRGIEITLQKKMARDFYGLMAASFSKSEYKTSDGKWLDRVYDNRLTFSIEGGYKPNALWEFSLRWIYAGGAPYTPFDLQTSTNYNRAVMDENRINSKRYPAYHSLNIRFDRRFHFGGTNLVFYLSVWNAYDRKNVATYFWNQKENAQDIIYQWRMLPIFGFEFEF